MHIRFRRTFKLLPGVKLNVSRHGLSTSVGSKGMHLTFNKGGIRQAVGLPGTGLSETGYLMKAKNPEEAAADVHHGIHQGEGAGCELEGCGCLIVLVLIAGVAAYIGANLLHLIPSGILSDLLQQITQSVHQAGF